ncbi:hypothetical protein DL764_006739 [Monosporascus ibericus]|uniref:Uncharacterized protein n=1 Tax=Monosporascus ibericus TaxID=155417 RepID=A0A4Q4T778_9PEZI|nr:hypothetical protein DL764_006739 [Monosporascus ibericus]
MAILAIPFFKHKLWDEATPPIATESSSREPECFTKSLPRKSCGIQPLYPEDCVVDIVFVHGLTGNRDSKWTAGDATEPWPEILLPSILSTAQVLAFGYDAYMADWRGVVSQNRISHHSWDLLTALASYRENDAQMNTVTSRQRSERHLQSILRSNLAIIFLGTPPRGAGIARWAELLSQFNGLMNQTNSEIVDILRRDSEVLPRIQDSFHTMIVARRTERQPLIKVSFFYEEPPLPGVGLAVPYDSAILPGYIPIGIRSIHMDMTKFASTDDPQSVAICGELRWWMRDMDAAETLRGICVFGAILTLASSLALPTSRERGIVNTRAGKMKKVEGNYFEAKGDQNFGMIPPE